MRLRIFPLRIYAAVALAVAMPSSQSQLRAEAPATLLELSNREVLLKVFYENPDYILSSTSFDVVTGAAGANQNPDYFMVEEQRNGGDLMQASVFTGDPATRQRARLVLQYALDRQIPPEWEYPYQPVGEDAWIPEQRGTEPGQYPNDNDDWHSTSLFAESLGRAALLLMESLQEPRLVLTYRYHLQPSLEWFLDPEQKARYERAQARYTHRRWLLAALLNIGARLESDQNSAFTLALQREAAWYAQEAMRAQTSEGWFPEMRKEAPNVYSDGFDVSYHGVGLLYGARFVVTCKDPELRAAALQSLVKGADRLLTRINANGEVDITGSSRIGYEKDRQGNTKQFATRSAVSALLSLASLLEDSDPPRANAYAHAAKKMIEWNSSWKFTWSKLVDLGLPLVGDQATALEHTGLQPLFRLEGDSILYPANATSSRGSATFTLRVPREGNYVVWLDGFWVDGQQNSFHISVNGGTKSVIGNDNLFQTWHWVKQGVRIPLLPGDHTVQVTAREKGSRLRGVALLNRADKVPADLWSEPK